MCGSGRFLIPLLERGLDIEGVDASPQMLQACRNHCTKRGITAVLHEQFIERITLSRQYNLVIIPAASFCLVTDQKDAKESLGRIYALMTPGGKFVVEIEQHRNRQPKSQSCGGGWVDRPDGAKIVLNWLTCYSDEGPTKSVMRYELVKNGKLLETEFEDFNLRYYGLAEFTQLLKAWAFSGHKSDETLHFHRSR